MAGASHGGWDLPDSSSGDPPAHALVAPLSSDGANRAYMDKVQSVLASVGETKPGRFVPIKTITSLAGKRPANFERVTDYLQARPNLFEAGPGETFRLKTAAKVPITYPERPATQCPPTRPKGKPEKIPKQARGGDAAQPPPAQSSFNASQSTSTKSARKSRSKKSSGSTVAKNLDELISTTNLNPVDSVDSVDQTDVTLTDLLQQRNTHTFQNTIEDAATTTTTTPDTASAVNPQQSILRQFMWGKPPNETHATTEKRHTLFQETHVNDFVEYAGLGMPRNSDDSPVYLNTHEPFCLLTCGLQGGGKSHTLSCVVENCMISCPPVTKLAKPMATLVLHYDQSETNFAGLTSVTQPNRELLLAGVKNIPTVKKILVLLSPSFYKQRCRFYQNIPNVETKPLLFTWSSLNASQIKSLMRIESDEKAPLYMGVILEILRGFQRESRKPRFQDFYAMLTNPNNGLFSTQQQGPLQQRLELLQSFIADSARNQAMEAFELDRLVEPGTLVLADLTDPLLAPQEANGIFQVLVEKFRSVPTECGRLLCMDEAHKYMANESGELGKVVIDIVRQMRHHGLRVAISTQSPVVLPAELLELVSVAVVHQFQSRDWLGYLQSKLPFQSSDFEEICSLAPGECLVYAGRSLIRKPAPEPLDPWGSAGYQTDSNGWATTDQAGQDGCPAGDEVGDAVSRPVEDHPVNENGANENGIEGPITNESVQQSVNDQREEFVMGPSIYRLKIRRRLTLDCGSSIVNAQSTKAASAAP